MHLPIIIYFYLFKEYRKISMNNKQIILYYTCISIKYFRYSAALMRIALGIRYHL